MMSDSYRRYLAFEDALAKGYTVIQAKAKAKIHRRTIIAHLDQTPLERQRQLGLWAIGYAADQLGIPYTRAGTIAETIDPTHEYHHYRKRFVRVADLESWIGSDRRALLWLTPDSICDLHLRATWYEQRHSTTGEWVRVVDLAAQYHYDGDNYRRRLTSVGVPMVRHLKSSYVWCDPETRAYLDRIATDATYWVQQRTAYRVAQGRAR
jgi:hypothetical protein